MAAGGPSAIEVVLQNPCGYPEGEDADLMPWLSELVADVAPGAASFGVRLTSDREMRRLNRTFRGKDRPTDVLSFPGGATPEGEHLGDVVIAMPVARSQAVRAGHSTARELRVLLLHGVLHCLGHDHETDQGEMARLEAELARRWVPAEPPGTRPATTAEGSDDAGA